MTAARARTHQDSVVVDATPGEVYDLVSDIARTGEWSPVCTSCWWDDEAEAGHVGAWFTGRNELPDRTWETRSQVVAADHGREFAWIVGGAFVRWGFLMEPDGGSTRLTETWEFTPEGLAMFADKYGDAAASEVDERTRLAHDGIPRTLAAIKEIAERA
ncbi:SRPBCC family protein [Nocardioides oleivorans]|uniref:SRPBCC family protein n=1 Tax=Nocardioides oleivorans TaxID=273676 RepID=A0A4V1RKZ7_9ACTN|nr:SRPBCC family protein [Nocardioides oleivorans]RYB94022.1 SRPBCC family protein [Nocardioides oleivorans]